MSIYSLGKIYQETRMHGEKPNNNKISKDRQDEQDKI